MKLGAEIQEAIEGVLLLNIPDEFAWTLYFEGKNVDNISASQAPDDFRPLTWRFIDPRKLRNRCTSSVYGPFPGLPFVSGCSRLLSL